MKTQLLKVSTQPCHKLPDILATAIRALRVALLLCLAMSSPAVFAVDAVWLTNPTSGDWNTGNNWSTAVAPLKLGDTATFNTSKQTSLTLSGSVTVNSITFNSGASVFTINTHGEALAIIGAGFVNNSGQIQAITNNAALNRFGMTLFQGIATAGNAMITNNGGAARGAFGVTAFAGASTAGSATIINNGAMVPGGIGGVTAFINTSNAGRATITNNGGTTIGALPGATLFGGRPDVTPGMIVLSNLDTPSAGSATIISNGGTGGGFGGTTEFLAHSDGGTARAITNGNGNFDISRLASAGMGIGSIEGSGNYFLGSKTLTVGGNNLSTTVSGIIQDGGFLPGTFGGTGVGGSLTKIGTGTLTLTGMNTYTGATTVNGGSLIVDGSIASAQTLVNAGGLLGGHGSLGGSLVNSGIVRPGDSPGTLTVSGNYTQNAGGTLRIEVAGLAANQHDLLAVNGHASLAGTLQLIGVGSFTLHAGDQITFLTAKGGVSGTFGTVQNQLATAAKVVVVDLPNAVLLAGATATEFGEPVASVFNIGVSVANVQTANLQQRMEDVRAGSTGFSTAGLTLNGNAPSVSGGLAGVSGPEGKSGPSVMAPTPENRWGVWVTGIGEFTNVDSTNNAAGYYLKTGGLTLGVDYRVSSYLAIGLTAGYAHTGTDLANSGNLDVNSGTLGLYATVFGSGFYVDTSVTGGPSGYNTHRTALLGGANGSTDGGNFNVLVAAGYDWKKGALSIGPTANFQFTYVGLAGFTESGSIAPLNFPDQNSESERTAFGMKASYEWKVGRVIMKPEISLAWQHEYGDQAYSIVSSFASGGGNSFTVNGPQIGRDSLLVGAGAAALLSDRISIYAYYDGEFGRTNYQSSSVSAGVRVTF